MDRILTNRRFAVLLSGLLVLSSRGCGAKQEGPTRLEIPAGTADSVVVATEYQGKILYAETGIVVASDAERSTIYVDARPLIWPMEPLPGKPEERSAVAILGIGSAAQRVPLEKSLAMANGTTLYTAKKSELPAPLPKTSDIAVQEGMPLLLIGCDIGFAADSAEPEIVAVKAKVDRVFRNPRRLEAHSIFETEAPLNLRTGILTTLEGKIVAIATAESDGVWREAYSVNRYGTVGTSKVKVPKDPRAAAGNRRFEGKPLKEIERAGSPEIAFLYGNFKISDGTARIEFALAVDDPFGQLKNPRLLVSTKNRMDTFLDGEPGSRNTIDEMIDEATVTVRDGVWTDRVTGDFEVVLTPTGKIDPTFDKVQYYPVPKQGRFFSGSCTFPVKQTLPFVVQCVVDDEEKRMTPLGKAGCLRLYAKIDANGRSLLKMPWESPVPYAR